MVWRANAVLMEGNITDELLMVIEVAFASRTNRMMVN